MAKLVLQELDGEIQQNIAKFVLLDLDGEIQQNILPIRSAFKAVEIST